jgi:hypothetical protein
MEEGGIELFIDQSNWNERTGPVWVRFGIWKVRGKMIDAEKGRCLLRKDGENTLHILLKCNESQLWSKQLLDNKWLHIHEATAHTHITCNKATEIQTVVKFLYKEYRKLEN